MRLIVSLIAMMAVLAACVSREVERQTVVEKPRPSSSVEVVPGPPGDTTVVVPHQ